MALDMHENSNTLTAAQPSREQFLALAEGHTLVPLFLRLNADLETPVTAFLRLASDQEECFLLESVEGGETIGRYTFIGVRPFRKILARGAELRVTEGGRVETRAGDVFQELKRCLNGHAPARLPGLPPFTAGAVGFFSYDAVRLLEQLPSTAPDELGVPDACLLFFDEVLAFDHLRQEMVLVVTADVRRQSPEAAYAAALERLRQLAGRLGRPLPASAAQPAAPAESPMIPVERRTAKPDYLAAVARAQEYIAAGDVFQVVLSQRFDVAPRVNPFHIYRSLRVVNPSPYMYFLRVGLGEGPPAHIVGSSPEMLVRVTGRRIEYRPIAGTRPRGVDEDDDRRIDRELLADEKERAEHVMLVDLGRNDVGRVSEYGSVQVRDLMRIERYSHVMHIVSAIEGRLRPELDAVDALRACFPAGTLSGAPKVRAMEIIEELEPARRGLYGGAILYADYSGNLDSCIAIRTLVLGGEPGPEYGSVQAGAGIVADSVAEREQEECENKASAVLRAIERARGR